ncbi:Hypothetical predicted protein [Pelobates cultripes]|uniref:Uncharacterized protein n=1 Tax=Pelobates cultripes TaxID=61616 RepID=A0AAD1RPI6_PELCU|nr:Hypothetical predicted protein [Pelobates cultripes]
MRIAHGLTLGSYELLCEHDIRESGFCAGCRLTSPISSDTFQVTMLLEQISADLRMLTEALVTKSNLAVLLTDLHGTKMAMLWTEVSALESRVQALEASSQTLKSKGVAVELEATWQGTMLLALHRQGHIGVTVPGPVTIILEAHRALRPITTVAYPLLIARRGANLLPQHGTTPKVNPRLVIEALDAGPSPAQLAEGEDYHCSSLRSKCTRTQPTWNGGMSP